MIYDTREEWLNAATEAMAPWLKEAGMELPSKVRASVGFAKYGRPRAIGQCWSKGCTPDDTTHIFICPTLDDPKVVLGTHLHELVHAAVGTEAGHKGPFLKGVRALGLRGKATATFVEEGSPLEEKIIGLIETLGPYPHSPLQPKRKERPAGGGWIKLQSIQDEDYIIRISPKAFKEHGVPTDPWGNNMVEAE